MTDDTTNPDAPTFPTDPDGAGMNEPRQTSNTINLADNPTDPTATFAHKDETYYNANPPSTPFHDERMRDQAGDPQSPQSSPSAYPDYTNQNVNAKRAVGSSGDFAPTDADSSGANTLNTKWKQLPTQDDWESLGVGSSITRTTEGWEVIRKVTAGGGFAHGAGRTIRRAFQLIGASYDMSPEGKGKLVDAAGEPILADDDSTTK